MPDFRQLQARLEAARGVLAAAPPPLHSALSAVQAAAVVELAASTAGMSAEEKATGV